MKLFLWFLIGYATALIVWAIEMNEKCPGVWL